MNTQLAVMTPEEQAYLDSLDTGSAADIINSPARLVINELGKDAEGNKRVVGSWHIKDTNIYYDGIAKFRPIRHVDKLIRYTSDDGGNTWNFAGQSAYFTDYASDIIDSLGGLALGRKFGKVLRSLPPADQEANRALAGTYKDIFGFVSFDTDEQHPVVLRVRGGKYKSFLDAFNSVPKDKKYSQFNFNLETVQKVDSKTNKAEKWWSINITPDMSQVLPITPILAYDAEILEYIRETNHQVLQEHLKNRDKSSNGDTAKVINVEAKVVDVLPDDEELPF